MPKEQYKPNIPTGNRPNRKNPRTPPKESAPIAPTQTITNGKIPKRSNSKESFRTHFPKQTSNPNNKLTNKYNK